MDRLFEHDGSRMSPMEQLERALDAMEHRADEILPRDQTNAIIDRCAGCHAETELPDGLLCRKCGQEDLDWSDFHNSLLDSR